MSTNSPTKINKFLQSQPHGVVWLASWLEKMNISRELQRRYEASEWFERIGRGAFIRKADHVTWMGGVYALQHQANLPIHVGARTALTLEGFSHYIRFGGDVVQLFAPLQTHLPLWFYQHQWDWKVQFYRTAFLPEEIGVFDYKRGSFSVRISAPERAILEYLYLVPNNAGLSEGYYIMEGLVGLRPRVLQELLEKCTSVKVKRLFFYMAEKASHQWLKYLKKERIDFGKGKRALVKQGIYVPNYQLTLPRDLISL